MSIYLDTSALVPLFVPDPLTRRAEALYDVLTDTIVVSDLAAGEFASAVARFVRTGQMTADRARLAFENFDTWTEGGVERIEIEGSDLRGGERLLRRLDLPLFLPDTLHLIVCARLATALATFDQQMARCARQLGLEVVPEP